LPIPVQKTSTQAGDTLAIEKRSAVRMPELDGVRGIAILLVLVWHYFAGLIVFEPGSTAAHALGCLWLSWSGVDLFFVLSGFLIGGILIDNQRSDNYFRVFYVRRVCRIFPLYYLWFLLFCSLLLAAQLSRFENGFHSGLFTNPLPLWSYATFSQNLLMPYIKNGSGWMDVTWSLAVEEQFYCVLPFIIRYLEPRKLPWLLSYLILGASVLRFGLSSSSGGLIASYVFMPCRADALCLGVLCAWMTRQQKIAQLLEAHTLALYAVFVILLLGAAALTISWRDIGYTWLALLYSCLLLITVTEKRGIIKAIAMNSLLRRLGITSYGTYLFHSGMLGLTHGLILHQRPQIHNVQDLMITIFALILTLALANLSWNCFEKRLVSKAHRLNYKDSGRY